MITQLANLALAALVATVWLSPNSSRATDDQFPTVTVTGTAEIRVVPDEAVLTFSVESRDKELDATVKDNDAKIKAVVKFLQASKIETKHIRTQLINIRPVFEQSDKIGSKGQAAQQTMQMIAPAVVPPKNTTDAQLKPIGYTARRQLSISIKELDQFEAIYRGIIERGVNDVGGVQFLTSELRKHRDEARLKAVRAAREKALAMAQELGARLASVQSISEDHSSRFSNFLGQNTISVANSIDDAGNRVAAGMIEIKASVRVVFRLGNTEMAPASE